MESIEKLRMKRLYPGPVLILLCSSSVAWVEQEMPATLGEQSKRIDGKIKINPLNFLEVVRAFPQYQVSDCIRTYGVIGGVAGYINHWDQRVDLKNQYMQKYFKPEWLYAPGGRTADCGRTAGTG